MKVELLLKIKHKSLTLITSNRDVDMKVEPLLKIKYKSLTLITSNRDMWT